MKTIIDVKNIIPFFYPVSTQTLGYAVEVKYKI